jgi:hypothetical protein
MKTYSITLTALKSVVHDISLKYPLLELKPNGILSTTVRIEIQGHRNLKSFLDENKNNFIEFSVKKL